VAVAAFNEERLVAASLESIATCALPGGSEWGTWYVINDRSTDLTSERVHDWALRHGEIDLQLLEQPVRGGKAVALERARSLYLTVAEKSDVLLLTDADTQLDLRALQMLLVDFLRNNDLVAAAGSCLPMPGVKRCLASSFQMRLIHELDGLGQDGVMRSSGRLSVFRPQLTPDFSWKDLAVVDDVQLASYINRRQLPSISKSSALVYAKPVRTFADFHKQTDRARRTNRALATADGLTDRDTRAEKNGRRRSKFKVLAKCFQQHPVAGIIYLTWWGGSMVLGLTRSKDSLVAWEPATSSKEI
jgi:glycosyltransferase involved in cell wall biosynthesis